MKALTKPSGISRRSSAYSSMTRRAYSSRVGFDGGSTGSGSSRGFFNEPIGGMSYSVGCCNPGELIHSSRRVAVSACRALRSKLSLARPGGSSSASFLASSANKAKRSFRDCDCLKRRRRFFMTDLRIAGPNPQGSTVSSILNPWMFGRLSGPRQNWRGPRPRALPLPFARVATIPATRTCHDTLRVSGRCSA
jgi:hypothetical protein